MPSLASLGFVYTQNFDTLAAAGTSSILPTDWVILETGTNANTTYTAGTGSSNTGDTYSFGAAASPERALGGLLSGSLTPTFGASFTNNTGGTIASLAIAYTGEQWRLGTAGRGDRIDFQYSLNATSLSTGVWIDANSLDFTSPISSGAVGALNGNAAANRVAISDTISGLSVANGTTFWIRWTDFNATGADDGLAVDDFSLSVGGTPGPKPTVNLSVSSHSGSEDGATQITVTATASAAVSGQQTVTLGVTGGGITIGDYSLSSTTITIADGQVSGSVTFGVVDDAVIEPEETAELTISDPSAGIELGGTVRQLVSIADNDTRIHDIQGAAHRSPMNGQSVASVPGIVTAVASNGFYFQDPLPDADTATSEAIFVFTSSAPTVAVGDSVRVSGTVSEFRPGGNADNLSTTEIISPTVTTLSTGNALPAAVLIGAGAMPPTEVIEDDAANVETSGVFDPASDGIDFWESLEGMRVQLDQPLATSPTIHSGTSEELWVLADNGAAATSRTVRGGSLITASDYNPERIQIDDLNNSGVTLPDVNVGALLGTVTGVIGYSSSNFELLVSAAPEVVQASPLEREITSVSPGDARLAVATFNVENLDPGDGAAKFNALAARIVFNLRSPDILNLEEVQDNTGPTNDGVTDASVTLQMLIDAIAHAGGPTYEYRQINPANNSSGGEPGGNIRVVFLFNPARGVSFVEGSLKNLSDTNLVDGDAFANSRKPLVGEFMFNGEKVTLVGNHFVSKGGDDPLFGPTQPPVLSSEALRDQQAGVVKGYVQSLLASDPRAKVLVLGDLNDFEFSSPLSILESAGLTTLVETLPAGERYSYNFQGNAQALDQVLSSAALLSALDGVDVVHINSEFFEQVSDHDPVVARFHIDPVLTLTGTAGRDTLGGGPGNDVITGLQGRDLLVGGRGGDRFVYTGLLDLGDVISDFEPGDDRLVIAQLLAAVGYAGSDPVADGYLNVVPDLHRSVVLFDLDGSAGPSAPRPLADLIGVQISDAGVLLYP